MNEGQFLTVKAYGEENSSLLRQVLDGQKRTNELLERLLARGEQGATKASAAPTPKVPAEAVGPVVVETVETIDSGKTDASRPVVPRRVEQTEPVEMAVRPPAVDPSAHTTTQTGGKRK